MTSIKNNIIKKIQHNTITPKAKIYFILKKIFLWSLIAFSIFMGSVSFSVILFSMANHGELGGFFPSIPFLWLVSLGVLIITSHYIIRSTDRGYTYRWWIIIASSVVVSIILGSILFAIKIGSFVDREMSKRIDTYKDISSQVEQRWNRPEDGLVSGVIISIKNNTLHIVDSEQKVWKINIQDLSQPDKDMVNQVERIRFIGELDGEVFTACAALPWFPLTGELIEPRTPLQEIFEQEGIYLEILGSTKPLQPGQQFLVPSERNIEYMRNNICRD